MLVYHDIYESRLLDFHNQDMYTLDLVLKYLCMRVPIRAQRRRRLSRR